MTIAYDHQDHSTHMTLEQVLQAYEIGDMYFDPGYIDGYVTLLNSDTYYTIEYCEGTGYVEEHKKPKLSLKDKASATRKIKE